MIASEKLHQIIKDAFGDLDIDGLKITIENKKVFIRIDMESEE